MFSPAPYPDLVLVNRYPYVQDDGTAEMYCVSNYADRDLNWNLLPTLGRDAQEMIDNQDRWLSGGAVPSTFAMTGRLFGINADAEGFRAGAWNCSDDGQGYGSWVIGVTNFRSTIIKPFKVTQTVNEGERGVELIMNQTVPEAITKRWNRGPNVIGSSDTLALNLDAKRGGNTIEQFVSPGRGVLDCYQQGQREDPTRAGIMRVIVRSCGGNKFGVNCTHDCKRPQRDDQCMELLFCMPDPWGCSCATGFRGDECDEFCPQGRFGADCNQNCNCKNGSNCNIYTGRCPDGCREGWKGATCQEGTLFLFYLIFLFHFANFFKMTNKKEFGAIVGALVAVLMIGGVAGAAYYFLKVKKNKGNEGRVSPEAQGDSDEE
uniref:EGF-like domain-containing protein n=1 Tax=Branchiostoma floridae TaxID=7739 RepID=C3ZVN0_BRAFL|eukprot:XP_002587361.1 hypothetical protein BRAFLDRAFT_96244 [Branchiostoma floridae]